MHNDGTQDVDLNNNKDNENADDNTSTSDDGTGTPPADGTTTTPIVETPEAKFARLKRQQEQLLKKHPELSEDKPESKSSKSGKKSDDLDYGQKAFLIANGIKGSEETALVRDIMANTGKSLDDVLESKYFQSELKEMRDAQATAAATPSGSKRTGQSAQNTVEYWIARNELPPASERELRQKVVNARIKSETSGNQFTNNPVVK